MKAQRLVHTTRGQERVAKRADKPLGHGKRMNSRQAMNTHGSGACTRLRHHPLISNQYRSGGLRVKGYGLEVERKGKAYFGVPAQAFLGEMSC